MLKRKIQTKGTLIANFPARSEIRRFVRIQVLKRLIRDAVHIFVKGSDKIAILPLLGETYEPELSAYFKHSLLEGFGDSLIDVGANIGLVSCQEGDSFKRIFCYEPNYDVYQVLITNIAISGLTHKTVAFDYGLGETEGEFDLLMPRDNFGAGFVRGLDNSYSDLVLARKDNSKVSEFSNYLSQRILVKNAAIELGNNFTELSKQALSRGLLKIDVEGMEISIIKKLIEVLPKNFSVRVLFENHDEHLQQLRLTSEVMNRGTHGYQAFHLVHRKPYGKTKSKLAKGFQALFNSSFIELHELTGVNFPVGTIVLTLTPNSEPNG